MSSGSCRAILDGCRFAALLPTVLVLTLPSAAIAARPPEDATSGWVTLPEPPEVAMPTADKTAHAASDWRDFQVRHPGWAAWTDPRTGRVRRAMGPGVWVDGPVLGSDDAGRVAERFLREQHEVTGAANAHLELVSATKPGEVWYVHFRQLHEGIPVLNTDVTVRLWADGRVIAFGSEVRGDIDLDPRPRIDARQARVRSTEGLSFDFDRDRVRGGDRLRVLPIPTDTGTRYALVRQVRVSQVDPPHEWDVLVDAHTGEVLRRHDRIRYAIEGNVSSLVHPKVPSDPLTEVRNRNMYVGVNGELVTTDELGHYLQGTAGGVVDLTFEIRGPFGRTLRADPRPSARIDMTVDTSETGVVDLRWENANSHPAERDAFHNAERVHAYVKSIDPSLNVVDFEMPIRVLVDGSCNAFWNGQGINFFRGGDGCNNSAMILDVVAHEYAHGVNDRLYEALRGDGMTNGALNEGLADIMAAYMLDDPVIGHEFFQDGRSIRTVDNDRRFPGDIAYQVHRDGLILSGALWDLREDVGLPVAERLVHFAKYGTPDSDSWQFQQREAFSEFLFEMLVADEDDGDLSNGSPHRENIDAAFAAHGLSLSLDLKFTRWRVENPEEAHAARVIVGIDTSYGVPPVDAASVVLHYRLNAEAETHDLPMSPRNGGPLEENVYEATLPPLPEGTLLAYYFSAAVEGFPAVDQPIDPQTIPWYRERLGTPVVLFRDDFSRDRGWVVGAPDDDATDGVWTRDVSELVRVADRFPGGDSQTNGDHTHGWSAEFPTGAVFGTAPRQFCVLPAPPPHDFCVEDDYMQNEVDGQTTLTSPIFDLSEAQHPVIDYVWWFSNNMGPSPRSDPWRVDLSNDGGQTWVNIRETTEPTTMDRYVASRPQDFFYPGWRRELFRVEDHLTPTSQVQLRIVVADRGDESLVEGAVDDFSVVDYLEEPVAIAVTGLRAEWKDAAAVITWSANSSELALEGRARNAVWSVPVARSSSTVHQSIDRSPQLLPGTAVEYRLLEADDAGSIVVAQTTLTVPAAWVTQLLEPRPNPFNPRTTLSFTLDRRQWASLVVYDLAGRIVATVHDGVAAAGRTELTWEGLDDGDQPLASGVYLVRLRTGGVVSTRKVVLLR